MLHPLSPGAKTGDWYYLGNACDQKSVRFQAQDTQMDYGEVVSKKWLGLTSGEFSWKVKLIHLKQKNRTERQILVLSVNVAINSIVIKPREKGR
jgi:hypothetical protein